MSYSANILVIDDDESLRAGCVQTLTEAGCRAQAVQDGLRGMEMIARESFDVIVLDLKMPGLDGMEVLRRIKENDATAMVIVITGYGTIDIAVEAMRCGAYDFLTKPFTPEGLIAVVSRAAGSRQRTLENVCADSPLSAGTGEDVIIGRSPAMINIAQLVKKVAPTDSTVLIHGETGVGKELITRTIHRLSSRRDKPFVTVDCGSLVESLFESEMFGHAKGSYTGAHETTKGKFEIADGGTIFLDEIANINLNMQARLLRVIQEREFSRVGSTEKIRVDVRITSATNRDLPKEIRERRFREDLFYRLNVVPIHLPPVRERREDIPLFVTHFINLCSARIGKTAPRISEEAMRFITGYDWPGNIRELKNAIERAVVTCDGISIKVQDLGYETAVIAAESGSAPAGGSLAASEKEQILKTLKQFKGHKAKTAEALGINRKTLREKIRRYGIEA